MLTGTNIPLPNDQQLNNVTVNGANDTFTVQQAGTYEIEYAIHLTAPMPMSTRITKNGASISTSEVSSSTGSVTKMFTVALAAGDTISLQLYGLLGMATLSNDPAKSTSLRMTKQ